MRSPVSIRAVETKSFEGKENTSARWNFDERNTEMVRLSRKLLSSTDILGALPREAKTLETHKTGLVMSIARTRYQRHDIETVTVRDKYTEAKFSEMVQSWCGQGMDAKV